MADTSLATEWRSSTIDFKTTGATLVIPAAAGKRFFPTGRAWVEFTAYSGVVTGPVLKMGNNASTYDNVHQGSSEILGATNMIQAVTLFVSGGRFTIDVGSVGVYVNVGTAATGTTCQGIVVIEGFYR
jgi:hypothetical protein